MANLNYKCVDPCRREVLHCFFFFFFLVQSNLFDFFFFLRPLGKGRMMGMFMRAGCVVCCAFLTSEKQLLVCCRDVFTGRAGIDTQESSEPSG